ALERKDLDRLRKVNRSFVRVPRHDAFRHREKVFDAMSASLHRVHECVAGDAFSGPEASRNCRGPTLRDREEEIKDALACDQGDRRHEPLSNRTGFPDGPRLDELHLLSVVQLDDDLVDLERPLLKLGDLPAAEVWRDHDPMLDVLRFLNGPDDLSGGDGLALFHLRIEPPRLLPREAGRLHPAQDEIAHDLLEARERALNPVIYAAEESRAQFDDEGSAGVQDRFAWPHPARVLVHLDDRLVAHDLDDLAEELLLSHELDVVHPRAESRRRDDGSRDPEDLACPFPRDALLPLLHRHVPCSM